MAHHIVGDGSVTRLPRLSTFYAKQRVNIHDDDFIWRITTKTGHRPVSTTTFGLLCKTMG